MGIKNLVKHTKPKPTRQIDKAEAVRFFCRVFRIQVAGLVMLACAQAIADKQIAFVPDKDFRPVMAALEGVQLHVALPQPEERILVGGSFNMIANTPANGIVRIDSRGTIDNTFKSWPGTRGTVFSAAPTPDGKIMVGGRFAEFGGEPMTSLARLNTDGSLDPSFKASIDGEQPEVRVIRVQQDGRVLIGGRFKSVGGVPRSCVARMTVDGHLDETFDPAQGAEDSFAVVYDLAIQENGKILVAGAFTKFAGQSREGLVRLLPNGSVDDAFQSEVKWGPGLSYVRALQIDRNGRILLGGRFDSVNGIIRRGLARLLSEGELDPDFDPWEGVDGPGEPVVTALRVTANGQIIVAGHFSSVGTVPRTGIAVLAEDGTVDEKFDPGTGFTKEDGAPGTVNDVALLSDGSLVAVGDFSCFDGKSCHSVARLMADGLSHSLFGTTDILPLKVGSVNTLAHSQDGGYLVGGSFDLVNGLEQHALARLTPAGELDTGFASPFPRHSSVNAIVCLEKGQLLVGGEFETVAGLPRINIARLDADGTPDAEFDAGSGPNGPVYALAQQPTGGALVGGAFAFFNGHLRPGLARVDWSGAIDPSFDPVITYRNGAGEVYAMLVQSDGRILVGGFFDSVDGIPCDGIARLMPNGDLDRTFGNDLNITGRTVQVLAISSEKNGRILVAGAFEQINGQPRNGIARLEKDGALDMTFVPGMGIDGGELPIVYTVQPYAETWLLLAGEFSSYDGLHRGNIAQTSLDGAVTSPSPTTCFTIGTDALINALLAQENGGVLIGGGFTRLGSEPVHALARLKPVPSSLMSLTIELEGGEPVLRWNGSARLQMCRSLTESWEEVPDGKPPYRVPAGQTRAFFRLVQ